MKIEDWKIMNRAMNILLTSAGRRTYMVQYFKHALGDAGKVYAGNSEYTATLQEADGYVITPMIYNPKYIDFLLEYCKEKKVDAVISLFDVDLTKLSDNAQRFEEIGVKLIVSGPTAIHICNDKWMMAKWFERIGIAHPKTYLEYEEAIKAVADGEISFPLFVKPRWGMGSIGVYKVENEEELNVLYKKVKKTCMETYLKYESEGDSDRCVLIQEMIRGTEYGMNVLNDLEANYVTHAVIRKESMRAGETDIAITQPTQPFDALAKSLSENLRHIGNLDVDIIITPNGDMYVIELNARFGGQYPFVHNAGADYPQQIVNWLQGKPTDFACLTPAVGVKSCKELTIHRMDW